MKDKNRIINKVFWISLLIYPVTFAVAVYLGTVVGIDRGWAMPAWSDGELMYGWDAIWSYLILIVWGFSIIYGAVFVFQIGYLIFAVIQKIKNKGKNEVEHEKTIL